jgi:transcriptional antiterminator
MSYILKHLPEIDKLKEELEQNPNKIVYYAKYGGYVGSSESSDYLNKKLEEYYASKSNK